MWQDDTERPSSTGNVNDVCAGQAAHANNDQHPPSPMPMFPLVLLIVGCLGWREFFPPEIHTPGGCPPSGWEDWIMAASDIILHEDDLGRRASQILEVAQNFADQMRRDADRIRADAQTMLELARSEVALQASRRDSIANELGNLSGVIEALAVPILSVDDPDPDPQPADNDSDTRGDQR